MELEALRLQHCEEWTRCAGGWREYRASLAVPSVSITKRLLQKLADGEHVLDLACGNGNPTFAAAEMVGPDSWVLGLALTAAMGDEGIAWARGHGIGNVEFWVIPDETHRGVERASIDAATCRAGLRYMSDREGATRGVFDALGPGGRFVAMTLGAPDLCMPFTLTNGIVARHVTLPKLGPDRPGPVGLSTLDQFETVLRSAGFVELSSDRFIAPTFEARDPAAAWRLFVETARPFMALLASLSDEQRRATGADVYRTFAEAFPDDPVRPTGEALGVCGVKAIMSVDAEELVNDYLRLGLRFGRLIDGSVDSWTGAPALQEQVAAEAAITPRAKVLEWTAVTFTTGTTMPTPARRARAPARPDYCDRRRPPARAVRLQRARTRNRLPQRPGLEIPVRADGHRGPVRAQQR